MNIVDLMSEDGIFLKKVAQTSGGIYKTSCPWCGGKDRFSVYPARYETGAFICNQCDHRGDTIAYLMQYRSVTFAEACKITGKNSTKTYKPAREIITANTDRTTIHLDVKKQNKNSKLPNKIWREKLEKLAFEAHKFLLSAKGKRARAYLFERGLTINTIKKSRLGYFGKSMVYTPKSFGLDPENHKKVWIPAGFSIPFFNKDGELARIRVRQERSDFGGKYIIIAGSKTNFYEFEKQPKQLPIAVFESEFDAILVNQEAGDIIQVFAIGNDTNKPDFDVNEKIKAGKGVLFCADFDDAGGKAFKFWENNYKAMLWYTPTQKDVSDSLKNGLDVREWIQAGIENLNKNPEDRKIKPEYIPEKQKNSIEKINTTIEKINNNHESLKCSMCLHGEHCNFFLRGENSKCGIKKESVFDVVRCPKNKWWRYIDGYGQLKKDDINILKKIRKNDNIAIEYIIKGF